MRNILVPIDFSGATPSVVAAASGLARAFQATIVLVHVIRPALITNLYSFDVAALEVKAQEEQSARLASWRRELQAGGLAVEARELYGDPAACIRDEAKRLGADLIVIGSHGHGAMYDLLIGSTAAGLLKRAPCPVLIVPITGLQPVEGGSCAEPGVEIAGEAPAQPSPS